MTGGLGDVSSGGIPKFDVGPLGDIGGILDKFDISFEGLIDEFISYFHELKSDMLTLDRDRQDLIDLKPMSLSSIPDLLQLGSKKPATQFSPAFKAILWNKLILKFSTAFYNGVRIPGLPIGQSLSDTFPGGDGFPSEFKKLGMRRIYTYWIFDRYFPLTHCVFPLQNIQLNNSFQSLLLHTTMLLPFQTKQPYHSQ